MEEHRNYEIAVCVAIPINGRYISKKYNLSRTFPSGIHEETFVSYSGGLAFFVLGQDCHLNYFYECMKINPINTVEDIVNIFQKTVDEGIKIDSSINNSIMYEYIGLSILEV